MAASDCFGSQSTAEAAALVLCRRRRPSVLGKNPCHTSVLSGAATEPVGCTWDRPQEQSQEAKDKAVPLWDMVTSGNHNERPALHLVVQNARLLRELQGLFHQRVDGIIEVARKAAQKSVAARPRRTS